MSAIAGLIDWGGGPAGESVRAGMHALALHGRDGQGLWEEGSAALGWRQTILHEEDYNDIQPLTGQSGVRLVFDGRIDNRADLARELGLDHEARSWPDSAFALAAFEKWGVECTDRLLGDFSFAVWDAGARRLVLARDHMGHRPLFFHRGAGFVMFASMPSALFTNPRVPMDLNDERLLVELALVMTVSAETIFRGIDRVQPGHAVIIGPESMTTYRHWRPEAIPELRYRHDDDYVDAFREILQESVSCRLRTIHPIGSHLSSGWDSSTVTAVAASLLSGSGRGLTAFTAVPPEHWRPAQADTSSLANASLTNASLTNEGPVAAAVAARFPNVTHILSHWPQSLDFAVLDRYSQASERPRKVVSLLGWMERLHFSARERGIRVMLSGGFGNRTISCTGLETLSKLFRRGHWVSLIREWRALSKAGYPFRQLSGSSFGPYLPEAIWSVIRSLYRVPDLFQVRAGINLTALSNEKFLETVRLQGIHPADLRRIDYRTFRKLCTMSHDTNIFWGGTLAAYDLEIRDPTADRRLVAFRAAIPDRQFLHGGNTRWLLRRTMADILPPVLTNQVGRAQQAADWFTAASDARNDLRQEVDCMAANPRLSAMFDVPLLRKLTDNWPAIVHGKQETHHYLRLLMTVCYARFARIFLERAAKRASQLT